MKILLLSFLVIITAVSFGSAYATTYDVSMPKDSSERGCEIIATCYLPNSLSISLGDIVVWTNDDNSPHTVTSGSPETGGPDEIFDSSIMKAGETFSHKFTQVGTFPYFCLIHPWMEGSVKVEKDTSSFEQTSTTQSSSDNGGCLIATATFGSELASQVQQLRELRDNSLLQTESGTSFMESFNNFYYSFSPYIADYERENPVFKEVVKIAITPMINSLSILNYVDMDSEESVLGFGISLILLNVGMYFVAPAIVIVGIRKRF